MQGLKPDSHFPLLQLSKIFFPLPHLTTIVITKIPDFVTPIWVTPEALFCF